MSKDNINLVKYLGVLFLAALLIYKLPHDSYSIVQYIIRPIRFGSGYLHLSGLIPLILIIIAIKGFVRLERFEKKSKLFIIIVALVMLMPIMTWVLEVTRTNYHWVKKDGLNAVDIKESNISLASYNEELRIQIELKLIDYSRSSNEFKIRVYLPDSLSDYVGEKTYVLENYYRTHGNRKIIELDEYILINLDKDTIDEDIFASQWYYDEVIYELFNEQEAVKIIDHGV